MTRGIVIVAFKTEDLSKNPVQGGELGGDRSMIAEVVLVSRKRCLKKWCILGRIIFRRRRRLNLFHDLFTRRRRPLPQTLPPRAKSARSSPRTIIK